MGLKNLGNTCYLASVVQAIANLSDVSRYFIDGVYEEHLNFSSDSSGEVATAFAEVINAMWDGLHDTYSPTRLKAAAGFPGSHQHDAADFLTSFITKLHDDLDTVLVRQPSPILNTDGISPSEAADLALQNQDKSEGKSFFSSNFYGQSRTDLKCTSCGAESYIYDRFLELQLPIAPNGGLERLLEKELEPEIIDRDCPRPECNNRQATKTYRIIRLPKILCVQLKRFFFNTERNFSGKIERFVDFPLEVDMAQFITGDKSEYKKFKLSSVVNHYGQSNSSGHYTTMGLSSHLNKWVHFNDSHASAVSPRRIKTSSAYLLFFVASGEEVGPGGSLSSAERSPQDAVGRQTATSSPNQSRPSTPPPRPSTPNLSSLLSGVRVQDGPMETPPSRLARGSPTRVRKWLMRHQTALVSQPDAISLASLFLHSVAFSFVRNVRFAT